MAPLQDKPDTLHIAYNKKSNYGGGNVLNCSINTSSIKVNNLCTAAVSFRVTALAPLQFAKPQTLIDSVMTGQMMHLPVSNTDQFR